MCVTKPASLTKSVNKHEQVKSPDRIFCLSRIVLSINDTQKRLFLSRLNLPKSMPIMGPKRAFNNFSQTTVKFSGYR